MVRRATDKVIKQLEIINTPAFGLEEGPQIHKEMVGGWGCYPSAAGKLREVCVCARSYDTVRHFQHAGAFQDVLQSMKPISIRGKVYQGAHPSCTSAYVGYLLFNVLEGFSKSFKERSRSVTFLGDVGVGLMSWVGFWLLMGRDMAELLGMFSDAALVS